MHTGKIYCNIKFCNHLHVSVALAAIMRVLSQ